jgi:hypothetical protein
MKRLMGWIEKPNVTFQSRQGGNRNHDQRGRKQNPMLCKKTRKPKLQTPSNLPNTSHCSSFPIKNVGYSKAIVLSTAIDFSCENLVGLLSATND